MHGCFGDIVPFTCSQPVAAALPPPLAKRPVWSDKAVAVMLKKRASTIIRAYIIPEEVKVPADKMKGNTFTVTFKYASSKKKENDKQNDARVLAPNDSLPSSSKLFSPSRHSISS